jgi:hypothetical protein
VNFVQNHPLDGTKVIVYAAPEGDEVATYTRGSARLVNGEARVKLGVTFAWVTNPDIGLTAHLTPRGEAVPLAVKDLSTAELVVSGPSDVSFDYIVYGLRIGFEETCVVRFKEEESWIPSMNQHRDLYQKQPDLRTFNAFERHKGMRTELGVTEPLDLSRAVALKAAIHEFQPGVDKVPVRSAQQPKSKEFAPDGPRVTKEVPPGTIVHPAAVQARAEAGAGKTVTPAPQSVLLRAERFPICEPVQEGDVLTNTPDHPGTFCLTKVMNDPGVVGIVVAEVTGTAAARSRSEAPYDTAPVAPSGVALCKADATLTPILANDLLVASPIPGHAMKAPKPIEPGTVIGKALEPLESGMGLIRVLVMLR